MDHHVEPTANSGATFPPFQPGSAWNASPVPVGGPGGQTQIVGDRAHCHSHLGDEIPHCRSTYTSMLVDAVQGPSSSWGSPLSHHFHGTAAQHIAAPQSVAATSANGLFLQPPAEPVPQESMVCPDTINGVFAASDAFFYPDPTSVSQSTYQGDDGASSATSFTYPLSSNPYFLRSCASQPLDEDTIYPYSIQDPIPPTGAAAQSYASADTSLDPSFLDNSSVAQGASGSQLPQSPSSTAPNPDGGHDPLPGAANQPATLGTASQSLVTVNPLDLLKDGSEHSPPAHDLSMPDHDLPMPDHDLPMSDHELPMPDHDPSVPDHSASVPDHSSSVPDHSSSVPDHSSSAPARGRALRPKPGIRKSPRANPKREPERTPEGRQRKLESTRKAAATYRTKTKAKQGLFFEELRMEEEKNKELKEMKHELWLEIIRLKENIIRHKNCNSKLIHDWSMAHSKRFVQKCVEKHEAEKAAARLRLADGAASDTESTASDTESIASDTEYIAAE